MRQAFLLFFLCCCFTASYAQTILPVSDGVIKGVVADSANAAKLGFVTVVLKEAGKDQAIKSTYTKDNGSFEISGLPYNKYQLIINYMGYQRKTIDIANLSATHTTVDLGSILLTSTTTQLKEVEVTAEKLLVTQDVDKIAYNVDADPESQTLTALDMLRKVPLLSVDAEDNIQLNGSGSYRILINGKTSSLFVRNPKDVFKSMPASTIKSIEVITNPPSKYEAEGVGGIINIITHKKNIGGYNGSINLGVSEPRGVNAGGYLTAKAGKFGFSGYFGQSTYYSPTSRNYSLREDRIFNTELEQIGRSNSEGNFQYFSGEVSFELDTLNLFTANYNFNISNGENTNFQDVNQVDYTGQPIRAFSRISDGTNEWSGNDFGVDYQRTFKKSKEQLFTLSYKYNSSGNGSLSNFRTEPRLNYSSEAYATENDGRSTEHTVQADYVQPIKKHTFEVGVKGIFRLNSSDYFYKRFTNIDLGTYELVPELSNNFDYRQDIYAAYSSINLKKDKWGMKVGLRLEETVIDANFRSSKRFVEQDYFNPIPNVTISRMLKSMSSVRFSYTQRIERPSLYLINPYVNAIDTFNISYGNPKLEPATNNVFTLAYNTFIKGSSINASLFHNFTNNSIQRYTTLGSDSIARTTYENIGKNRTYGLSLFGNTTLFKKLSINLNGTLNYVQLNSFVDGQPQDNSGLTANIFAYSSYRFEKDWRLSGNIGYNSPSVLLQGRSAGYMFNSLSLSKQFLKENKATVNFSVSNPFQKERRYFNEVQGPEFTQLMESYFIQRRFNLSFNYRFGKLKGDIARKKRGIKNDDLSGGGGEQKSGN
ncbi:outer membrane beta-barrel family protein [Pontibacter sp. SGAir0037]|uniref:outer membrane beta-barrel family protein n=1 Tax=Pontibacter sp. SGAir0037 TaxID=2571030 RepID=UPI0010CCC468|nr:outer membrane beta-barrel family protein [Pontibacter sp. SGAir0037]QCR23045.1 hypothetical protein C1N53_12300 [Pontibacter sp. SGAir0037]